MSHKFDIVIIGAGNAGFGVSQIAQAAGKSIAFVESDEFGGTCPNRGCTPKKVLVAAAHAMHEIELAHEHGIEVGPARLDWAKLIERKRAMIDFIPGAMEEAARSRGQAFKGKGRFVDSNAIEVDGVRIEADNFVIATGSVTRPLSIPGAELMITSDDVLSENSLPDEVVFIGGGVIAMEFSHVYAHAGARVTILEAMPQLLPRLDQDAVAAIRGRDKVADWKTGHQKYLDLRSLNGFAVNDVYATGNYQKGTGDSVEIGNIVPHQVTENGRPDEGRILKRRD